MTRIGADPDELKALVGRVEALGRQLERSGSSIDTTLRRTRWHGRDAERFRSVWSGQHRSAITRAATDCVRVSEVLSRNADEQVLASADTGTTPGIIDLLGPSVGSMRSVLPAPPITADPDPSLQAAPDVRVPDEVVSFGLGVEGSVASVVAAGQHDVTVESHGDERLVTIATRDAVGVRTSAGGRIALGPVTADLSLHGDALLGVVTRNSFETDAAGVATTIIRAELEGVGERLKNTLGAVPLPMTSLIGSLSGAVTSIGRTIGILPEPVRTETLAELAVSGSMGTILPMGPGGRGTLDGVVRLGVSEGSTGQILVVEAEGTVTRTISTNSSTADEGPGSPGRSAGHGTAGSTTASSDSQGRVQSRTATPDQTYKARLEIRDGERGANAVLRIDAIDGSQLHRTTMQFTDGSRAATATGRGLMAAASDIRAGRIDSAIEVLTRLRLSDAASSTTHTTYDLSTIDGAIGGSVGLGVTVGGSASVEHTRMTRVGAKG